MRNLKRVLSLAMASVMLLGMMVMGTSAANYPDVDAQNNLEAIEVLKAVGIMTGDENGNFNPDAKVTRNEMAVVMVNLLGLKAGGVSPFTDVPAWAQPYVNACYAAGVTSGISATQYGGSNTVTAVEAALMTMKTLGYFGYQGEFGDDWKVATIARATKIDLFGDLDLYVDEALTRDDVAQLVLNALESDVVVVTEVGGMSVEGNGITVNQKPTYSVVVAADKAGHNYDGVNDRELQLTEKLFGAKLKKNADSTDDFGRPANEWTYGANSIKTPKAAAVTYTKAAKEKDIYTALGLKSTSFVPATAYVNGNDTQAIQIRKGQNSDMLGMGNGTVTEIYVDEYKNVTDVIMYQYFLAQAAADYDEADDELVIEVKATGVFDTTLKGEDFAITNYKEDDYLLLTATSDGAGNYTIKSIEPASVVSGLKVSDYDNSDYVIAGGTKYNYNKKAVLDATALGYGNMTTGYTLQDTEYDLILDKFGYVIGVEPTTSEKVLDDYVIVLNRAQSGFDVIAKVAFMDGSKKTVTVSELNGNDTFAYTSIAEFGYYTFNVDKNGEYELTAVAAANQKKGDKIDGSGVSAKPVTGGTAAIYAATNDTVFIADDVVYTGVKNAPVTGTAANSVYVLLNDSGYIMAAYTPNSGNSTSSTATLVYILSADGQGKDENKNTYNIFTAIMDGKKQSIKVNVTGTITTGLYEVKSSTDGYMDLKQANKTTTLGGKYHHDAMSAANISYKSGVATFNGSSYTLADDVTIYLYNGDTVRTISAANLGALATGTYTVELVCKSTTDSTVVTVFVVKH